MAAALDVHAVRVPDDHAPGGMDTFRPVQLDPDEYWLDHRGRLNVVHRDVHVLAMRSVHDDLSCAWLSVVVDDGLLLNTAWTDPDYRQLGMFAHLLEVACELWPNRPLHGVFLNQHVERLADVYNERLASAS